MPYPVKPLVVPPRLKSCKNGKLPANYLTKVTVGGELYIGAAAACDAMTIEALKDGVVLKSVGSYRPFLKQFQLFQQRFSPVKTKRVPEVTRIYLGKKWWLKVGMSPVAVPGTSNHGFGLAVDFDLTHPKVFPWLCANAPKFGFYLQGKPTLPNGAPNPEYEAWHWQKVDAR